MHIIAGLGNPSLRYRHTRHNVGFDSLDILALRYGISIKKKEFSALTGVGRIEGHEVMLVKPQTYMNKSGESIAAILKARGLAPESDLTVLVDDIHLDCGSIRIRQKGSAGGHNGLGNIIAMCGTQDYNRIRIGVGRMPQEADQIRYVLSRPGRDDSKLIKASYDDVSDACALIVQGRIQDAMNAFNGKQRN